MDCFILRNDETELFFYQFSSMQFPDFISTTRYIRIMSDHHDGIACFFVESIYDIHHSWSVTLIEISCRFIRQQIVYICNKCSSNSNSLLFSTWEFRWIPMSLSYESYFFENLTGCISTRSMRDIENEINILFDCQIRYEFKCLKYECNMLSTIFDHRISTECRDIDITEYDRSILWRYNTGNQREESRLPCSARTHECNETPSFDMPIQTCEKCHLFTTRGIGFWDVFECDHSIIGENSSREESIRIIERKQGKKNWFWEGKDDNCGNICVVTKLLLNFIF